MTNLYIHKKLDTDEVFYVGIGKGNRPFQKRSRSVIWHNIVNKHGYYVEVIRHCENHYDACEWEKVLIKHFGRRDQNLGTLVNHTNGGDGVIGHSDESKKLMSLKRKGKPSNRKGTFHTQETKDKLRAYTKINSCWLGTTGTGFGKQYAAKNIMVYENELLLNTFGCIKDACIMYEFSSASASQNLKGKTKLIKNKYKLQYGI